MNLCQQIHGLIKIFFSHFERLQEQYFFYSSTVNNIQITYPTKRLNEKKNNKKQKQKIYRYMLRYIGSHV